VLFRSPDLEDKKYIKFLPNLVEQNIFCADFFDPNSSWAKIKKYDFDWIIGNPPWKNINSNLGEQDEGDKCAWEWMADSGKQELFPVTNNQLAEAFTWKVQDYLQADGAIGLVIPATTLTKQSNKFRKAFFGKKRVFSVVNLANLKGVLFKGAKYPAAIICFDNKEPSPNDTVKACSPLLMDQITHGSKAKGSRQHAWSISINTSDIQELFVRDVQEGSHIPWKVAMWGTPRDMKLLKKLQNQFETFSEFCMKQHLLVSQGLELRDESAEEETEPIPALIGKNEIDFNELTNCRKIFDFPSRAIKPIPRLRCHVRIGRGTLPLAVCQPPHIILHASRYFAVYSDKFLAIPPRQIGIGGIKDKILLKALAVYLNSQIPEYFEFYNTTEQGIGGMGRATLQTLNNIPIPPALNDRKIVSQWAVIYNQLRASSKTQRSNLLEKFNAKVFNAFGLRTSECILIKDFISNKLPLIDGKPADSLMENPGDEAILSYLKEFKRVLDAFVGKQYQHELITYRCANHAVIRIRLFKSQGKLTPKLESGNPPMDTDYCKILHEKPHWR